MVDSDVFKKYYDQVERSFDSKLGGFSKAPKFPRPVIFTALYSLYSKQVVVHYFSTAVSNKP